jgi:hypothetical protein
MTISSTRVLAGAATLTLAALALAALAAMGPSYAGPSQPAAGVMTGAPTVGTCSNMTAQQAGAPTDRSTVVPCTQAHTAQVAGVVKLPTRVHWGKASTATLFRVIADRCVPKVDATLGRDARTRDSSAYDFVWFMPTKAQRSQGARWLSCSIIRPKVATLLSLKTSTAPFLPDGKLPDGVARCLTRTVYNTPCAARHLWRATGTFVVSGRYPGQKALNRKAETKCRSRVTAGKSYRWTYRDKITWNVAHDHVVVCYSKTRG